MEVSLNFVFLSFFFFVFLSFFFFSSCGQIGHICVQKKIPKPNSTPKMLTLSNMWFLHIYSLMHWMPHTDYFGLMVEVFPTSVR